MIKAYDISNAKKYNYSECVIPVLFKLSDIDNLHNFQKNDNSFKKIVIIDNVFEEIINLGIKINECDIKEQYKIVNDWIEKNYFPYPINQINNPIEEMFINDINNILYIHNITSILKRIITKKTLAEKDINNLKIFFENYDILTIVNNIGVNSLEYENFNFDIFISLTKNLNLTLENKDEFCYLLLNVLISYVHEILNSSIYIINNTMPIMFRKKNNIPKFYLYKSSNCIIGIAYYKLLNIIISNQNDSPFKSCEYCDTPFKINGNQKFCEKCIGNGIPKKLRDKNFRKSNKGKSYYKNYYKNYKKEDS